MKNVGSTDTVHWSIIGSTSYSCILSTGQLLEADAHPDEWSHPSTGIESLPHTPPSPGSSSIRSGSAIRLAWNPRFIYHGARLQWTPIVRGPLTVVVSDKSDRCSEIPRPEFIKYPTIISRVPTHLEKLEFGQTNSMHGKIMGLQKRDIFMEKSWNFVSVIRIFFNIRINLAEFILCQLCFFLSLIFDYWWLHVPRSIDVKNY